MTPLGMLFRLCLTACDYPSMSAFVSFRKISSSTPSFVNFYLWAKEKSIPIVILSSGMTPVIEALLVSLFAGKPSNIFIVANNVAPHNGKHINMVGGWQIKYRDDR